jgi:hypothetical protein
MSLVSARKENGWLELVVACDVCEQRGEGRMDALVESGWYLESISMTPHCCPECAEVRREHLAGHRAHSRQAPLAQGEIPRPC